MRGHKGQTKDEIMADIAQRDQDVLEFIREHVEAHRYPPSMRDIAAYLNVGSIQTAHRAVKRLVDQGLLTMRPGIARSIAISEAAMKQPEEEMM